MKNTIFQEEIYYVLQCFSSFYILKNKIYRQKFSILLSTSDADIDSLHVARTGTLKYAFSFPYDFT